MAQLVQHHDTTGGIAGERFTNGTAARTFPPGRVCRDRQCQTVLSIYNGGDYCSSHSPRTPVWARGRRRDHAPSPER